MNHDTTRRQLLHATAVGGTALAAVALLPASRALADTTSANASPAAGIHYVKGIDVLPDTSHASQTLVRHIRGYFQAKT